MEINLFPLPNSSSKALKLRKGDQIHFISRNSTEVVQKGSSDPVMGMIKTDKEEYSMDFIRRWREFGFLTIIPKNGKK